ncbi:S26 family signal peptidase [Alienimonas californiensis]|uniref:Signal peptidase I n=1 Tax=Alienimonas californiensis TaxID=2527989 RepID=A0A517P8L5_9PLAN|nr:S26 family signal peptidase [Alienimonas californiensis]QDT15711.1 signal peptidase I [Alienimonas californiensis]
MTRPDTDAAPIDAPPPKKDGTRETMESIVIAFVFCFLFKTFEAEAFVIPTGSMAPTLYGRHKDVECPGCGTEWAVGASTEVDDAGYLKVFGSPDGPKPAALVRSAKCPNCNRPVDLAPLPPFAGDRILVNKWPFLLGEPERWAVTVFKFPENPTTNYVKRMVGLPGETLTLRQGDLYRITGGPTGGAAETLRKEPAKQRAMTLPVYDHARPAPELLAAGVPERFAPVRYRGESAGPGAVAGWVEDATGWTALPETRALRLSPGAGNGGAGNGGAGEEWNWIRYRHLRPTAEQWRQAALGARVEDVTPKLILDHCAYNPDTLQPDGAFWVGDLEMALDLELSDLSDGAAALLELVEGDRTYRCRIDATTGTATLTYYDTLAGEETMAEAADGRSTTAESVLAEGPTAVVGAGAYELVFANVDGALTLWVDGEPTAFLPADGSGPVDQVPYPPFTAMTVQEPSERDFTPAGFAVKHASARAEGMTIRRDLYYRGIFRDPDDLSPSRRDTDGRGRPLVFEDVEDGRLSELASLADDPLAYARRYRGGPLLANRSPLDVDPRVYEMTLGADEFLMLGDNSPSSLDSRLWSNTRGAPRRHAVPRDALVGTAFAIYWPHGDPIWFEADDDGDGVGDGFTRGWAADIPGLNRWFYHVGTDGRIVPSYQEHGVPFLPNFERLFQRIR